jgi:tetratricopeptide (TPR) repeat protein
MGALDDLLGSWRSNPDADSTVALCAYLGSSGRDELVREIGSTAETWHGRDAGVMLSVGRMYLDAGLLPEAQAALVAAGKIDPASAKPFRFLGEVLLRRGDAIRAEKVLVRAMQLGLDDAECRHWHDRSSFYMALQKRIGAPAVAIEVAKALPKALSIPAPNLRPQPFSNEDPTNPRGGPLPRFDSAEEISQVEELSAPTAPALVPQHKNARARTMIGVAPPAGRAAPASRVVMPAAQGSALKLQASAPKLQTSAARAQASAAKVTLPSPPPPRPVSVEDLEPELVDEDWGSSRDSQDEPTASGANPFDMPTRPVHDRGLPDLPAPGRLPAPLPFPAQSLAAATRSHTRPEPFPAFQEPVSSGALTARYDAGPPPPGVLLEHLTRVGLFEPRGGAAPAWEQAPKQKQRGNWLMIVAIVLLSGAGVGGWQYARKIKADRAAHALTLTREVERLLHSGGTAELKASDQKLSEAFDLDSRSQRAARLWLENRVLRMLLLEGESHGIDSAIHRGRTVGLPEKDLAVGRMAAFLVEGDLAGAAAQLPKWDKEAGHDAYYQLAAGAVLEHAGDRRALERYEAARSLDQKLIPADLFLARLALLELGKDRAKPVIDSLQTKIGDAPIVRALKALSWVVDPERGDEPPAGVQLTPEESQKLPAPLACVPHMLEAARAVRVGDHQKLSNALDSAIRTADSPSLAAGLGFLAIEAGDEQLARKAALRAVGFAALYPRARTLAARVALLGGRIDEAEKAVEQLDPASADVAVVRAVAAYESLEPADVDAALKLLGEARNAHAFAALEAGSGVLLGTSYPAPKDLADLRDPRIPWGEIVATDAALNTGDLATAESILGSRSGEALRPVHHLRRARLLRYQGKAKDAVAAAEAALEGNVTPPVLIESVYDLVAAEDLKGARTLIAKYPVVLGPLSGWLAAFIDAHSGDKNDLSQAAARVAKLDPPPDASPLAIRLLVLRSLVATKDKRARGYLGPIARLGIKHPEVQLVLKEL